MVAAHQTPFYCDLRRERYDRDMAQQFGSVYRDAKTGGTWWVIACHIEGKRYRLRGVQRRSGKLAKFVTKAAANRALEEIRSDLRGGADPLTAIADFLPLNATHSSVESHYRAFCESKATDPSVKLSRQRITELWGHLGRGHIDELRALPIQTLSYADLDDWVRALFARTSLSENSVHHVVADVRTFLRWCERRGIIRSAPEVPVVRVPEYVPNIPTPAEVIRVLGTIEWRLRGVFLARGRMGLRPGEARDADVADYRLDPDGTKDVLTVRRSKSNRYRLLPVPAELSTWMRELRPIGNLRDVDSKPIPLFDNPHGLGEGRWSPSSERRVLLAAMAACGVGPYRPNEFLRHAYGTHTANRLFAEGHVAPDVMRRLMAAMGHTEPKTSAQYIRLATEDLDGL